MKRNCRLVAVDMDGTMLRSDKTIGERTVRAVNTALACGTEVVIATGRSRAQMGQFPTLFPEMRYLVCSGGAVIYDMKDDWKKILSNEIPVDIMSVILECAERFDCFPIVSIDGVSAYVKGKYEAAADYGLGRYMYEMRTFGLGVDSLRDWYEANPRPAESVSLYFRDFENRQTVVELLGKYPLHFALLTDPAVEISLSTANKGCALQALCDLLQLSISETMAIGDSDNDVPMLRVAGLAVASGNAPDDVKGYAHYVTADCDHDGVGQALERFVLNEVMEKEQKWL